MNRNHEIRELLLWCAPDEDQRRTRSSYYGKPLSSMQATQDTLKIAEGRNLVRIDHDTGTPAVCITSAGEAWLVEHTDDSLTEVEYFTLRELRDARPQRVQVTVLASDPKLRGRKKLGKVLSSLAERGLVDYESRGGRGATITPEGLALLGDTQMTHE